MDCRIDPVRPGELVMLYKLRKGVCPQSHGMECALSAGLPKSLVGRAREKAASFERSVATRGPKSKPPKSHDAGGAWDLRGDAAREREREMDVDEHETLSGPVVKPADAERSLPRHCWGDRAFIGKYSVRFSLAFLIHSHTGSLNRLKGAVSAPHLLSPTQPKRKIRRRRQLQSAHSLTRQR